MASFLKPMPRARAEELLAGVLERTDTYNADDSRSLVITKIAVFGSYLRLATELGTSTWPCTTRSASPDQPPRPQCWSMPALPGAGSRTSSLS